MWDEYLLTEYGPGRYRLHDLLRDFAAECVRAGLGLAERDAAARRVLAYYLHAANAASDFLFP